jgi:hypothetical protein
MRSHFAIVLGAGLSLCLASAASAAVVTGITSAAITGSNYDLLSGAFDSQPTVDPVAGEISTHGGSGFGGFYGTDPSIGIDFGSNYATKIFTNAFVLQGSYGTADMVINYYWSTDTTYDAGTDLPGPNLNLFNYSASSGGNSSGRWELEYSNPAGVTPSARYLIGRPVSGSQGNFVQEIAFTNSTVPEPASLSVLGLGGLMLLGRKRQVD